MKRLGTCTLAIVVAAGLAIGFGAPAAAQYPEQDLSLVLGAGDTTPQVGQTVTLTATVLDAGGAPAAGVSCTFSIADQPGSDASVAVGPYTTASDGTVSTDLDAGSTPGTVVVAADCEGLSAQVSLTVGASGGQPGAAQPPASLPDTGLGTSGDSGVNWLLWTLIGAGALIGASGLGFAWRRLSA
jgi:hypothetical protein